MPPPESLQLRLLPCPILAFRCRASFVPSPSECSTLPACCFQWVSIRHRLARPDRKSTRLNSSHSQISYAVFCLKKKKKKTAECDHGHYAVCREQSVQRTLV